MQLAGVLTDIVKAPADVFLIKILKFLLSFWRERKSAREREREREEDESDSCILRVGFLVGLNIHCCSGNLWLFFLSFDVKTKEVEEDIIHIHILCAQTLDLYTKETHMRPSSPVATLLCEKRREF